MQDYLDHYCERLAPGLWGEPFNALTNLAFIVAAIMAIRRYKESVYWKGREWDLWVLIILLFAIGIGSGLWHILATPWALQVDHYPVLLFINIYLLSCLIRVFRLPLGWVIAIFIAYHAVNRFIQSQYPVDFLNGSIFYGPTWVFLLGITVAVWMQSPVRVRRFAWATGLFSLSLIFRTIDLEVCNAFPWGTHFLWHLLNAVTLYLLFTAMLIGKENR